MLPNNLPPWHTIYQPQQCWLKAGVFDALVHDLRMLLHEIEGCTPLPQAAMLDTRTLLSSPESDTRAGYDAYKRRKGTRFPLDRHLKEV